MKLEININFIEKYLAYLINDIEYKRITKKLKKYDLLADVIKKKRKKKKK
jgi:hypothetical protein